MRKKIASYIEEQYGVSPEYPWERYCHAVFRHRDNKKWFALLMDVNYELLDIGDPSKKGKVSVINLKIDDLILRDMLFHEKGIIPAYHMNKAHWISVLLDGTVEEERVRELIDISFSATSPKAKASWKKDRSVKEWMVPANPKIYDVEHAFDDGDIIDWKQGRGIKVGDIVFLYAAAPISAVLFRCKVTETDIAYSYSDANLTINALMKIKLLKRYSKDDFTFARLRDEYGVNAIRGPRGIPNSLSSDLRGDED